MNGVLNSVTMNEVQQAEISLGPPNGGSEIANGASRLERFDRYCDPEFI